MILLIILLNVYFYILTLSVYLLAHFQLLTNLILCSNVSLSNPGVFKNSVDIGTHFWGYLKHASYQILKLLSELCRLFLFLLRMGLPENVTAIRGQAFKEWIIIRSCAKWWMASVEDKEDDTEREDIGHLTVVRLISDNFRSHISWSTNHFTISTRVIFSLGSTKVYDLNIVRPIK